MNRNVRMSALALGTALCLSLSVPAAAQEAASGNAVPAGGSDDIIVTARRVEERLQGRSDLHHRFQSAAVDQSQRGQLAGPGALYAVTLRKFQLWQRKLDFCNPGVRAGSGHAAVGRRLLRRCRRPARRHPGHARRRWCRTGIFLRSAECSGAQRSARERCSAATRLAAPSCSSRRSRRPHWKATSKDRWAITGFAGFRPRSMCHWAIPPDCGSP